MAKYSNTKAKINEKITTNTTQAITGNVLNEVLQTMVDSLGADYQFGGLVQPGSSFTAGEQPVVFLATTPGTYTNFGSLVVADGEVALLVWSGTAWSKQTPDIATRTEVSQLGQEVNELEEGLITGTQTLNRIEIASGGQITFNPITLAQDGDELEIIALPASTITVQNYGGYAFTFGSNEGKIIVGMGTSQLCLRADDNTWIYGPAGDIGDDTAYNPKKVKFKYTDGKIEVYAMDVLKATYAGQKTATIYGIGSQTMSDFGKWFGTIWKFAYTHNGVTTELTDLPGYTKNALVTEVYDESEGRVPVLEEKVAQLEEDFSNIMPNYVVESTENQVKVYTKLQGNIYAWFGINHIVNTADTIYADLWRIGHNSNQAGVSGLCSYSDGVFTDLGKYLLNYAENEFAIMFYSDDFTGGAHGNERIDLDPSCYVVFIVDGKEYTINELNALGRIECGSFSYRQKSALYTMYSVTGTHDILAYHTKRTLFVPGGFVTRNYVEMVQAITARTTYSGLFCIYKDASDYAINDGGTAFTLTHPSSTTQIGAYSNKADRTMKMYKGGLSCEMDSRYIGGNVDSYKNANVNITLWDRPDDAKYYSLMPSSVSLAATSVFEFEASVRFDYRDDS